MTGGALGGGVVIALAAALWLAYLLPTWLRSREYEATERNAVRLQQTLRILAETSEVPNEVRLEASAHEIAIQQRILRKSRERTRAEIAEQAKADARRRHAQAVADAAAARAHSGAADAPRADVDVAESAVGTAAVTEVAVRTVDAPLVRLRRLRRARAATSLLLLAGCVMAGWGIASVAAGATWTILAAATLVTCTAVAVLVRLARAGRVQRVVPVNSTPVQSTQLFDPAEQSEPVTHERTTWTPQPLPKPLYLSRGTIAASAMASVDAVTQLRRAAAQAELDARTAELAPVLSPALAPVAQLKPRPAAGQADAAPVAQAAAADAVQAAVPRREAPSRFARMGLVEQVEADSLDLDAVLRRRRAAG